MGLFSKNKNSDLNNIDNIGIIQDDFSNNYNQEPSMNKGEAKDLREYLMGCPNIADIYTEYVSGNYNSITITSLVDDISIKIRSGEIKGESKRFNYQNLSPTLYIAYVEVLIQAMNQIENKAEVVAQNKYDKISNEASDKIASLEKELSQIRQDNLSLQDLRNSLQADNNDLAEENEASRNSINSLQNKVIEMQNKMNNLEVTINDLNNELNQYKEMPSVEEKDNEIIELKNSVAELNKTITGLKKNIMESDRSKSKLLEDNRALNNKCTLLNSELQKSQSSLRKFQSELQKAADTIDELQQGNDDLSNQIEALQKKSEEENNKPSTVINDDDIDSRLVSMKDTIVNKDNEIAKMAEEYSKLKRECVSLKRDLACTNDAEKILPQYKQTIASLQKDIDNYVNDILNLTKETTTLKAELELLKSKEERPKISNVQSLEKLNVTSKDIVTPSENILPNGLTLHDIMLCGYWSKNVVTSDVNIEDVAKEILPNLNKLDHNDLYNSYVNLVDDLIVDTEEGTEDNSYDIYNPVSSDVFSNENNGGEIDE